LQLAADSSDLSKQSAYPSQTRVLLRHVPDGFSLVISQTNSVHGAGVVVQFGLFGNSSAHSSVSSSQYFSPSQISCSGMQTSTPSTKHVAVLQIAIVVVVVGNAVVESE